jgi:hypothetical protein
MKTNWTLGIAMVAMLSLLEGCAAQLSLPSGMDLEDAERRPVLRFQSNSVAPLAIVDPEFLEPGDILLSAEPTAVSAGIRLLTIAPVSHAAVYVGDGQLVDAMRWGVRVRELNELLEEAAFVLVLRYPELTAERAAVITKYSVNMAGAGFSFLGITLQVPFSIARRVCEPVVAALRDACIRSLGVVQRLAASDRVFCSQLVLQAYRHAGVLLTEADPRLISPADILHMREGDVSSLSIEMPLRYVGHLKSAPAQTAVASLR